MDIREEFERLTEIAEILRDEDTHWCDKRGMYINQRVFQDSTTRYLNGAWYAFQEQQKKIDALKAKLEEVKNHAFINYDNERDDDHHSYWSGYNVAMCEFVDIIKGEEERP